MFSRMFLVLLFAMFIWKYDCAISSRIILEPNKKMKGNALEFVVNKYLNPLRKLTAELPNHAIEMQIEILDHDTIPSPVLVPQRRTVRVTNRNPKKKARSDDDPSSSAVPTQSDGTTTNTTPETTTEAMTTAPTDDPDFRPVTKRGVRSEIKYTSVYTNRNVIQVQSAGRSNDTPQLSGTTEDPGKRPVYMEDLNKALSDLEKKILQNTTPTTSNTPCSGSTKTSTNPRITHSGTARNIGDILQLLKKAVQVEKHIPQPYDDNLDWVQIKIPKDLQ